MKLTELFSSDIDYKVETDSADKYSAHAIIGSYKIRFEAERDEPENDSWWLTFRVPGRGFDLTGDGQAPKVLAFVKRCIEELIKLRNPAELSFSGGPGKHEVYKRMIKRFIPADKYKVSERGRPDVSVMFRVTRKDAE